MKAAVLHAPGDIRIEEVAKPTLQGHEVLIKIHSCGICGTDFHVYKGDREVKFPIIQGHEIAGEVVEIGNNVDICLLNKRVSIEPNFTCESCFFCRTGRYNLCRNRQTLGLTLPGGFCEFVKVPQKYVWVLSDKISYDEGATIEALTVGYHAVIRADIKLGYKVVVFGLGVIGLSIVQFAKKAGAQVCAVDLVDQRLQLAHNLGADIVLNAAKENSDLKSRIDKWSNNCINCVFEATGVPRVQEQSLNIVMPGGKLVLVGQSLNPMKLSSLFITRKEIDILGSLACLMDFPTVIELLERDVIQAKSLITHQFPLEHLNKAYGVIENQEAVKVVINC